MRNRTYLVLALLAFGSALALFGSTRSAGAKTVSVRRSAPLAATCSGTQLTVQFYETDAAMGGVRSSGYSFKNVGTAPCTLIGFPTVRVLDRRGRALGGHPVKHNEDTPAAVELAPGGEAFFRLDFSAEGAGYNGPRCPRVHKLSLIAPGTTRRFIRNDEVVLCGDLSVSPVGPPPATE